MKQLVLLIFSFVFFLFFSSIVFGAQVSVSGKISDQQNNPVSQATVVFLDSAGKTVGVAISDSSGIYKISIDSGNYTITVSGPKGTHMQSETFPNKTVSNASTLNFSLTSPKIVEAKRSFFSSKILYVGIGIGILIVGFLFWLFKRK